MALEKARETGLDTIAVSGVSDARVFDHSDARILLDIGPELVGPKTKGFIGSIATLQLFAMKSAEIRGLLSPAETANWTARMVAVTDQIPDIAQRSADWYQQQKTELLPCRRLIVLGYGNVMGAMREGTLKLLEACRYSVVGYEMEEFMHGVYHSIDSNTYLLYLGPQGKHYERMKNMARYFAEERKAHNYLITADRSVENGNNFIFPFKDDPYFESMEYVVPCQVLARKMSLDLGIDCNISSDPDFHRKMGSYTY
jgi:glucosamine 6-phosphate synthetase-like amidotransferase/phosphosugar isomerase protein